MSSIKQMLSESKRRLDVDEYLAEQLARAGYGGVEITKTPLGTRITVYVVRPGIVIGKGGEGIRSLTRTLEEKFKLFSPIIAVAEVPLPELDPHIMAAKIISSLERGIHFRRACYWALNSIMRAGALGVEIQIGGKLTTERSRQEKFKAGYIPRVGDPVLKNVLRAVAHTQLKPGIFGIKVTIVPPDYKSPDKGMKAEVALAPTPTPTAPPTPLVPVAPQPIQAVTPESPPAAGTPAEAENVKGEAEEVKVSEVQGEEKIEGGSK